MRRAALRSVGATTAILTVLLTVSVALRLWQAVFFCSAALVAILANALGVESRMGTWGTRRRILFELVLVLFLSAVMIVLSPRITPLVVAVYVAGGVVYLILRWRALQRKRRDGPTHTI